MITKNQNMSTRWYKWLCHTTIEINSCLFYQIQELLKNKNEKYELKVMDKEDLLLTTVEASCLLEK